MLINKFLSYLINRINWNQKPVIFNAHNFYEHLKDLKFLKIIYNRNYIVRL